MRTSSILVLVAGFTLDCGCVSVNLEPCCDRACGPKDIGGDASSQDAAGNDRFYTDDFAVRDTQTEATVMDTHTG